MSIPAISTKSKTSEVDQASEVFRIISKTRDTDFTDRKICVIRVQRIYSTQRPEPATTSPMRRASRPSAAACARNAWA
jgi:hypothetical protein